MYTPNQLEKFLFFDIETAGSGPNFESLSDKMQELWSKRSETLRTQLGDKYPDNKDKSDEELFKMKSALQAEFGRVVCISFGKIKFEDSEPILQVFSITDEDESVLLKKAFDLITKMAKLGIKLAGHNVKRFDVPFLCKRGFINRLELPAPLQVWDKKPWEISITDTSELWSFGAWQEGFTSLDLLATTLGIDSPKDDINGSEVHEAYYGGQIDRIKEYCQKDVVTLAQILLRLSNLNLIQKSGIIVKNN
jgi:predicted PolB exonuclease-like 3'-5' exonuclease